MNTTGIIVTIIIVVVILAGGWWLISAYQSMPTDQTGNQNTSGQNNDGSQSTAKGNLYFSFTDAAASMQNISAVTMSVDKVYVHSQAQGWVTVSTTPQTFSLLALKTSGKVALDSKATIAADTYDQLWFHVSAITVTESGKVKTATMPSNDFKMNAVVKVKSNADSTLKIDVLADQSLHKTDKGEFIFAPVVSLESRSNATVNVDSSNSVTVTNGTVDSNLNGGMDITGEVKTNFKLDLTDVLEINNGVINIKGSSGANVNTNTGANVNVGY